MEEPIGPGHMPQSISVTTRSDRSFILRLLQALISPLNTRLIAPPKKPLTEFSPAIAFSSSLKGACFIRERSVEGIRVYDLQRKVSQSQTLATDTKPGHGPHRRIYYFAGGGWQAPPSSHHFKFFARLLKTLPDQTVLSIISHPLGPVNPAPKVFPTLIRFYEQILQDSRDAGEKVILAGDSSGGNLAMSITLEALKLNSGAPVPDSIVLISPAVDLTHSNPELASVEKNDPLLRLKLVKHLAKDWAAEWDPSTDSRVSPLLAPNLQVLQERRINVNGIVGGYDILTPDAMRFVDKLRCHGVQGEWLEWEGLLHCWILMAGFGTFSKELKVGWEWLIRKLGED
jgi:acetyl esterase/lipase